MTTDARRSKRVAETIRAFLSEMLRRSIDDPRLTSLVITDVDVADDLSFAKIGVRLLVGDDDPGGRKAALAHLERASNRIRKALAPKLALRRVPELRFTYDTGHDAARRVDELLAEIANEPKARDD